VDFSYGDLPGNEWGHASYGSVQFSESHVSMRLVAHELGHVFQFDIYTNLTYHIRGGSVESSPVNMLAAKPIRDSHGVSLNWSAGGYDRFGGFPPKQAGYDAERLPGLFHPPPMEGWNTPDEDFADIFLNYADGGFSNTEAGEALEAWMSTNMSEWITYANAH